MKKIFIILFTLISFNVFAVDKSTTFSNEVFKKAQAQGKTVVINSWNKTCYTCGKQVTTIVVYKGNKEVSRSMGQTKKSKIYSQIKSL